MHRGVGQLGLRGEQNGMKMGWGTDNKVLWEKGCGRQQCLARESAGKGPVGCMGQGEG